MDLDDSLSLSMYELEKGVAVFTRSEECFDCYPAVQTAFKFTKRLHVGDDQQSGEDTEEEEVVEDEEKEESEIPLFYSEFHEFLVNLKQYYKYCKVVFFITLIICNKYHFRFLTILRLRMDLLCLRTGSVIQNLSQK